MSADFSTRPRRLRVDALGVVSLGLGLVFLVGVGWSLRSVRQARVGAEASAKTVRAQTQDLERAVTKAGAGGLAERLARAALVGKVPPRRLLAEGSRLVPEGVRIESLKGSYGSALSVTVAFVAMDSAAYDAFLERLRSSGAFVIRGASAERRSGEMKGTVQLEWRGAQ